MTYVNSIALFKFSYCTEGRWKCTNRMCPGKYVFEVEGFAKIRFQRVILMV